MFSVLENYVPFGAGLAAVIFIPIYHIYTFLNTWDDYRLAVDQERCTCSCWDTVFKGPYESNIASYKHFYFNATKHMAACWILTTLGVIALYELTKRIVALLVVGQLRLSMAFLVAASIPSHYYSWWGFINYINDEYWDQWNHQIFFSSTELLATIIIVRKLDSKHQVFRRDWVMILSIAIIHVLASTSDQFLKNVIVGEGERHQIFRDILLMFSDILNIFISICALILTQSRNVHHIL